LLCVVVMWEYGYVFVFAGTEASGGVITGPIENLYDISFLLFIIALLLTFLRLRAAAILTMCAAVLSFPLTLYFVAPNVFRVIPGVSWEGSPRPNFIWNSRAIVGAFSTGTAFFTALWNFVTATRGLKQ
jgi:hypothetical protein